MAVLTMSSWTCRPTFVKAFSLGNRVLEIAYAQIFVVIFLLSNKIEEQRLYVSCPRFRLLSLLSGPVLDMLASLRDQSVARYRSPNSFILCKNARKIILTRILSWSTRIFSHRWRSFLISATTSGVHRNYNYSDLIVIYENPSRLYSVKAKSTLI